MHDRGLIKKIAQLWSSYSMDYSIKLRWTGRSPSTSQGENSGNKVQNSSLLPSTDGTVGSVLINLLLYFCEEYYLNVRWLKEDL
ncbi:MAG: hypothetical protein DRN18_01810 [Thermoplasmata archaeon]|nr:MAG: hypothetical protein DRN18_01810 [Thermoplasmata archaeon]